MSYDKNTWQTGDIVTAEKLNNMENGIAGAGFMIVTIDDATLQSDVGYDDILTAMKNGSVVIARHVVGSGDMLLAIEVGIVLFFTGTLGVTMSSSSSYSLASGNTWVKSTK